MEWLLYLLLGLVVVYTMMAAYLYVWQRHILYVPSRDMSEPQHYGLYATQQLIMKDVDGTAITLWYTPPPAGKKTVMVYLHGNAGNLADRAEKLKSFLKQNLGVMAVSYRGYGSSTGSPTEQGLYQDARTAINYLTQTLHIPLKDIFLYGESLGSGVAIQMATEYQVKAIVLEAPYTSIAARGQEKYPFMPIKLLLKDQFDSLSKIANVHVPVLLFHGYLDQVMPIHHGRRLLAAANDPKEARLFENYGHSDFDHDELARLTAEFAGKY